MTVGKVSAEKTCVAAQPPEMPNLPIMAKTTTSTFCFSILSSREQTNMQAKVTLLPAFYTRLTVAGYVSEELLSMITKFEIL